MAIHRRQPKLSVVSQKTHNQVQKAERVVENLSPDWVRRIGKQVESDLGVYQDNSVDNAKRLRWSKDVFLTVVGNSTIDYFYNVLCNFREKKFTYKIVVVAADEDTFHSLTNAKWEGVTVRYPANRQESYVNIITSVHEYLRAGVNVVYVEPTTVFFSDPFDHIPVNTDLTLQSNVPSLKHDHRLFGQWKLGLFRVAANSRTVALFSDIEKSLRAINDELLKNTLPPTMAQLIASQTLTRWLDDGNAVLVPFDENTLEKFINIKKRKDQPPLTVQYLNALEFVTSDIFYKNRFIYNRIIAKRKLEGHIFTAVVAHADRPGSQSVNKAMMDKIGDWSLPMPVYEGTNDKVFDYKYPPIAERISLDEFCSKEIGSIPRKKDYIGDWEHNEVALDDALIIAEAEQEREESIADSYVMED
eukprot:CFRG8374T1